MESYQHDEMWHWRHNLSPFELAEIQEAALGIVKGNFITQGITREPRRYDLRLTEDKLIRQAYESGQISLKSTA